MMNDNEHKFWEVMSGRRKHVEFLSFPFFDHIIFSCPYPDCNETENEVIINKGERSSRVGNCRSCDREFILTFEGDHVKLARKNSQNELKGATDEPPTKSP